MIRPLIQAFRGPKGYIFLVLLLCLIFLPQIVENPFVLHLVIMMLFYAAWGAPGTSSGVLADNSPWDMRPSSAWELTPVFSCIFTQA